MPTYYNVDTRSLRELYLINLIAMFLILIPGDDVALELLNRVPLDGIQPGGARQTDLTLSQLDLMEVYLMVSGLKSITNCHSVHATGT